MKKPKTQLQEVLWHYINISSSLTKLESIRKYHILHVGEVIRKLRAEGLIITTKEIAHKNKFGRAVSYGNYIMCSGKSACKKVYLKLQEKQA
jgi:hypothetical protein